MRILQVCNKFPYPPRDGGAIATLNISRAFAKIGHGVTVLAMNTTKHYFNPMDLPEELSEEVMFHAVNIRNEVNSADAFISLILNRSYNVQRFISKQFNDKLREILKEYGPYDIVQLEGIYLAPYIRTIRAYSKAKIVLRAHNIENLIWKRKAANATTFLRKKYLSILARQLRDYETARLKDIDALVPISPIDKLEFDRMGYSGKVHVCPASYDEKTIIASEAPAPHQSIFFLGALDWAPNVEGLEWFIHNVWRKVIGHHPDLILHIAGRNMPEKIKFLHAPNVNVLGEVEDACQFMNMHNILIVPLFSGSGMRVKIIEGMAVGKVIITTPVGVEGISARNGEHLLIASTPEDFSKQILKCLKEKSFCEHLSLNASRFARENYGSIPTGKKLADFYFDLLKK